VSQLLSAIDGFTVTDVHGLAEPALLAETDLLLEARSRLDGVLGTSRPLHGRAATAGQSRYKRCDAVVLRRRDTSSAS
jgi:hypothetical protein